MRRLSLSAAVVLGVVGAVLILRPLPIAGQASSRFERETLNGRDVVAREVLVKFKQPVLASDVAQIRAESDAEDVRPIGRAGTLRLRSRTQSAAALIARLSRRPDIAYAEPNFIIHIASEPNDLRYPELWGLHNIGQAINGFPGLAGADIQTVPAWDISLGSTANVVAVIDTGIDYTHPDLAPNMWSAPSTFTVNVGGGPVTCAAGTHGFNAITRTCNPMDDQNHGTHVAGTIGAAGNNGIGVVGINWTTSLMAIKFIDASGNGTTADAIAAVEFAIAVKQRFAATSDANIRVLSNSWGGPEFSQALLDEVSAANDEEMLFVAGAGNDSFDNDILPFYPASFDLPNVVAVTATDSTDNLAWFSNIGAESVDLSAPGVEILSTMIGSGYAFLSGTSMATPHVSGAAALVLSRCDLNTAALKETLLGSVDSLPSLASLTTTGGRLNVNNALHACTAPPETPAGLKARPADKKVILSWSAALGALRYKVKRSLTPGGPYTSINSDVHGTTFTDTGLVNGTTYYYVVSAANALGESGDSNEASATPNIPPDVVVSALTAPAVAGSDATIVVAVTTKNQGAGIAAPSTTRFYWSDNSAVDASDTLLTVEQAVPQLVSGGISSASVSVVIPAGTTTGKHYLIARADDNDVLSESNETNNSLARTIQVGPDLVISSFSAPTVGAAGGSISVSDTVKNQGADDAASSSTRFYLSTNATIGAGDILLAGSRAVPSLVAGSTNAGATTLVLPATTAVGAYYIVAFADGDDVVPETTETNNTSAKSIQIGPDLVASALTAPGNGGADSTIVLTDTTKNQGGGPAGASITRFYLSTNSTLDGGDIQLDGSRAVPSIDAGVSSSGSTVVTIPASTAPGSYYVLAKADADGSVTETSETNNTASRSVLIGSDVAVSAISMPTKAGSNAAIVVGDTTTNQGGGPAGASVTRFYLSVNNLLDVGDILLTGFHQVPDLGAGASDNGSTSVSIPAVAAGQYYIIAKADADNVVVETKETNNTLARSISIGADLVVATFTAPLLGGAGASMTVSDTTTNQGGGSVAATTTAFYLSANSLFDNTDTLIGVRAVPGLNAGAVSTGSTTVTIPSNVVGGLYYLIAKADADAAAAEVLENNNTLARSVQIGADLQVPTISLPAKGGAGYSIVVSETTANLGEGDAPASVTRFYLSVDVGLGAGDVLLDGSRVVPQLARGASSAGSTPVTIPAGSAAGTYYIIAKADADNVVSETSETNNTRARTISIGPDLTVSSISLAASSVHAGAAVTVLETVLNQGAGVAGPSTTRFYLSANTLLDANDVVLTPGRAVADLAGGASSAGSTSVTIPSSTAPATYYVIAKADADGAVSESVENNNVSAVRTILVTAAP